MLPVLVIGAAVLLVLSIAKGGQASGGSAPQDKYSGQPGSDALRKAGNDADALAAQTTTDVATGVGIAATAVATVVPIAIKIAAAAGTGTATATQGTVDVAAGGAAAGGSSSTSTAGATAADTAALAAVEVVDAGLIGAVALIAAVAIVIELWIVITEAEKNRLRITSNGVDGVKARWGFRAFQTEEDLITDILYKAGKPAHKALTYDGQTSDAGVDLVSSGVQIPTIGRGNPVYYIDGMNVEAGDPQRSLVDIARWVALTKIEGSNEFLISRYFASNYSRFALPNLTTAEAIAHCNGGMESEGVAMTAPNFAAWRDGAYLPSLRVRAWKVSIDYYIARQKLTSYSNVVFDTQTWVEAVNVGRARVGIAYEKKLRVIGHGEALTWYRFAFNTNVADEVTTLSRLGYVPRASKEWPGQNDMVDTATGYYFTPMMVLRNASGQVLQSRAS